MFLTIHGQRFLAEEGGADAGAGGGGAAVSAPPAADAGAAESPASDYYDAEPDWSIQANRSWEDDGGAPKEPAKAKDTAGAEAATESGEQTVSGDGTPKVSASTAPAALDPRLYTFGEHLGLSREAVDKLGVEGMRPLVLREQQRYQAQQQPSQQQPKPKDGEQADEFEDIQLGDEFEPELAQAVKKLNERQRQQYEENKALRAQLAQTQQQTQAQLEAQQRAAIAESHQRIDAWFDEQDEEVFGRGRVESLMTSNRQAAGNRLEVVLVAEAINNARQRRGEAPLPEKEVMARAVRTVIGDRIKDQALQEAADLSRQQRDSAPAKPTHREPTPKTPYERAIARVAEFNRKNPVPVGEADY